MASSMENSSPPPLKSKLSQVKYLLDDANKRLHEEMSNYEIFTTKTSASASSTLQQQQQTTRQLDAKRTMNDISTLESVLSCPIFKHIVNVTDSLDKLSYHLNLHPSIGPSDISIDADGELILAPPIEPTSLNNLINSRLDEYSDRSNLSPHMVSPNFVNNNESNGINNNQSVLYNEQHLRQQGPLSNNTLVANTNFISSPLDATASNGFSYMHQHESTNPKLIIHQQQFGSSQIVCKNVPEYVPTQPINHPPANNYDTEKLVSNDANKIYANSTKARRNHHETSIDLNGNADSGRLYKSNGHFTLNQVNDVPMELKNDFQSTQSMNQIGADQYVDDARQNGYLNEMYKTTQELNQISTSAIEYHQQPQSDGKNQNLSNTRNIQGNNLPTNGKIQSIKNSGISYNRGSCSPSTSAGSTVRLADECDSGASSYQSATAKGEAGNGKSYSPNLYKPNNDQITNMIINSHNVTPDTDELAVDGLDQALVDNLPTEMEKIKVTLEKDENGLGIIIAGYTCEKEEISGIFIKSITPNSPADKTGKIRTLDQIFAVNGRELLGYSNKDALKVLTQTGKVVTLELMRYLAESKYRKLKSALAQAVPTMNLTSSRLPPSNIVPSQTDAGSAQSPTSNIPVTHLAKSSIPILTKRDRDQSPAEAPIASQQNTPVQVSSYESQLTTSNEIGGISSDSTSFKDALMNFTNLEAASLASVSAPNDYYLPIAAQRGGTNRVIETKQGARNTIAIRSPACQTTTTNATYVNKVPNFDFRDSAIKTSNDNATTTCSQREASEEFGRLIKSKEPEWEKDVEIIEVYKDSTQGLGFTVKDYDNPKDQQQSIIMITSLTPGGIAKRDGRLSPGDLLIFVDDINLEGASLNDAVKALKKTNGQVRLGVLKLKRSTTE